ncbi:MAG: hypothetical protein Q4A61_03420 [Porphyromonadaceae bacterium]|nr:hypothetical protein [Porphyromonadaceae bacterium]
MAAKLSRYGKPIHSLTPRSTPSTIGLGLTAILVNYSAKLRGLCSGGLLCWLRHSG